VFNPILVYYCIVIEFVYCNNI